MTAFSSAPPPGAYPDEAAYPGKSPWKPCLQLLALTLVAGGASAAFATSEEFRTYLRVQPTASRWAAGLFGGAATILFVCAAWTWHGRLRWVAASPIGLRYHNGWGAKVRRWDQFVRIDRGVIRVSVYGEETRAGRYADVVFKSGRPLRIGTDTVHGFEDLIAAIQTMSPNVMRFVVPGGGPHGGGTAGAGAMAHGPLRFDADGVGWDAVYYRWEEVESYEVAYGMLRIQPAGGPEFLRRLMELGDWRPAVAKLDRNCGSRRVGHAEAVR
jgi:hypothetical protein